MATKKAAKKKSRRTVMYSTGGKKLYAVRDASGKFKDIQQYSRAHAMDIKRGSSAETKAAAKKAVKKAVKKAATVKKSAAKKSAAKKVHEARNDREEGRRRDRQEPEACPQEGDGLGSWSLERGSRVWGEEPQPGARSRHTDAPSCIAFSPRRLWRRAAACLVPAVRGTRIV